MVGAQQTTEDTNSCLKQIHIRILAEGQLLLHPGLCFPKLCQVINRTTHNATELMLYVMRF